jgi:hypothetical protein
MRRPVIILAVLCLLLAGGLVYTSWMMLSYREERDWLKERDVRVKRLLEEADARIERLFLEREALRKELVSCKRERDGYKKKLDAMTRAAEGQLRKAVRALKAVQAKVDAGPKKDGPGN